MTNGKQKGKRGELEFARLCRANGYEVRRTAQYCGNTGDAADCIGLPGIHIEVKRVEHLNIDDALDQARRDAEAKHDGSLPIVAHRRNNTRWKITMDAEKWFELYREWEAGRSKKRYSHELIADEIGNAYSTFGNDDAGGVEDIPF